MSVVTSGRRQGGKSAKAMVCVGVAALAVLGIAFAVHSAADNREGTETPDAPIQAPPATAGGAGVKGADSVAQAPQGPANETAEAVNAMDAQGAGQSTAQRAGIPKNPADASPEELAKTNPNLTYYVGDNPKEYFTNRVENILERLTKQGARITEIPSLNLSEEEVLEFLRRPVDIYDDDDEDAVAAKERTAQFKQEALKFIEQGGTFNQFLRDLAAEANELAGTRKDAYDEAVRLADTQGREACEAYLQKVNPELEALGVKPIRFAPMFYEMRAKRLARLKELEKQKEN